MTFLGIDVYWLTHSWFGAFAKRFLNWLCDFESLHEMFCEPCWA